MSFAIAILSRARRQILGASAWWRINRAAAPELLDEELDRSLLRLAENPELGTLGGWPAFSEVRRLAVRRIEYVIFYRVRPRAKRVEVLAFWHARRGGGPPT